MNLAVAFFISVFSGRMTMSLFPIFMKLEGRRCLVIGAGTVAHSKIRSLLDAGARVQVVAPKVNEEVQAWADHGNIELQARPFEPADLDGVFLVIAATNSNQANGTIFRQAQERNILCNAVDDPENCDFYYPAVVRRGDLQIAISTAGKSPALAQRIRQELEIQFGPEYADWIEKLGSIRQHLFSRPLDSGERKRLLHKLAGRRVFDDMRARKLAKQNPRPGKVFLVGAGPGDAELLTIKAVRILESADVVLHDDLVGPGVFEFIPSTAKVHDVGKRCGQQSARQEHINRLLVDYAFQGLQVVRLKGGDPLLFGRGGEEIEALRKANIDFEIVPGVTAALAAAAAAQIPLTHRRASSALMVLTSHHSKSDDFDPWPAQIPVNVTLVVYMPGYAYPETKNKLLRAGLNGRTPCAVISQATSPQEQVYRTTIGELHLAPKLPAPTLLVVGDVVRFAEHVSLNQTLPQIEELISQYPELVAKEQEQAE
jgi:uroporphyrin-III C-methyltransferase / precorrin-2 dehydrogenase / sirohydrochlorin ferrochelatase